MAMSAGRYGERNVDGGGTTAAADVRDLVVILDGTLGRRAPGRMTHAGRIARLLEDGGLRRAEVFYEEGGQWQGWRDMGPVMTGRGINRQIRRAYGFLAARYRPGDRVFLLGYSRGAYAVRSLAGLIDRIGLLRPRCATVPMIEQLYRLYMLDPHGPHARAFARRFCVPEAEIAAVGVFDTVKALGVRLPVLAGITEKAHAFHSHHLGARVRHGFHALALDETRVAFAPVMWACQPGWPGHVEQVWFRGTHADVGGQLGGRETARPLANIPLVWMLCRLEGCGLPLAPGWRAGLPCDASAPSSGAWRGWGKLFALRRRRAVGLDPSERLHASAQGHRRAGRQGLPVTGAAPGGLAPDFAPGLPDLPGPSAPRLPQG
jgi:uncharacterized protein (DUF2235 family)